MKKIRQYSAEILSMLGCACILFGLSLWNLIIMWLAAGIMLIVFGVLIALYDAKEKAKNAIIE